MLQTLDSCCQSHKCWLGYRNDHFHSTVHSWCLIPYRSSKENTGFWWILQETCLKERESRKTQRKEALHPFEHYAGHMIGKSVYISIFILENFINDYVIFIPLFQLFSCFPTLIVLLIVLHLGVRLYEIPSYMLARHLVLSLCGSYLDNCIVEISLAKHPCHVYMILSQTKPRGSLAIKIFLPPLPLFSLSLRYKGLYVLQIYLLG